MLCSIRWIITGERICWVIVPVFIILLLDLLQIDYWTPVAPWNRETYILFIFSTCPFWSYLSWNCILFYMKWFILLLNIHCELHYVLYKSQKTANLSEHIQINRRKKTVCNKIKTIRGAFWFSLINRSICLIMETSDWHWLFKAFPAYIRKYSNLVGKSWGWSYEFIYMRKALFYPVTKYHPSQFNFPITMPHLSLLMWRKNLVTDKVMWFPQIILIDNLISSENKSEFN